VTELCRGNHLPLQDAVQALTAPDLVHISEDDFVKELGYNRAEQRLLHSLYNSSAIQQVIRTSTSYRVTGE
jgi:hypothetical protein